MTEQERATCRGCGRELDGLPYYRGGRAYVPGSKDKYEMRLEARKNHYGGFVCSRSCDVRASLELERSMPGHDAGQESLSCFAQDSVNRNWEMRK